MNAKEILFTLFYLALFNFIIHRFRLFQFKNFEPFITHLLFNLKFAAGISAWLVFTAYYHNGDMQKFYEEGLKLHEVAQHRPADFVNILTGNYKEEDLPSIVHLNLWKRNFDESPFSENRLTVKVNALILFLSAKTFLVHILFFCFFSLIGWILLTNAVFSKADPKNSILALPVLLLPSVLFWTSGVMKEPLLLLGLGCCVSTIINHQLTIPNLLKLLMGIVLLLFTRFFVLVCLLPAATAFLLFNKRENSKFILLKYMAVNLVLLFIAFNFYYLTPSVNPIQMLMNKQIHAIKEANYIGAESTIEIPELKNDAINVLKTSITGIWNSFARPYIWEAKNGMMMASAIENVLILSWLLLCFSFTNWKHLKNLNLFLFLFTFSLIYFAIIGICTPVLGNLVRYKTPLLPLLMFAFIIVFSPKAVADNLSFVLRK